jgi:hypothetical protein
MSRAAPWALILRFAMLAGAFPLQAAENAVAASSKEVLAEVSGDLNGDGVKDRAVLLHDHDGDDVDLAIYLSADGKLPDRPSVYKPAFGWTGAMAGTMPEMRINRAGSLVVVFQNDAVGRSRWRQQFTLAFRGGVFVVAGYTYEARDTLAASQGGNCDLNFLSGQGRRNGKAVKIPAVPIALSAWTDKSIPSVCTF